MNFGLVATVFLIVVLPSFFILGIFTAAYVISEDINPVDELVAKCEAFFTSPFQYFVDKREEKERMAINRKFHLLCIAEDFRDYEPARMKHDTAR